MPFSLKVKIEAVVTYDELDFMSPEEYESEKLRIMSDIRTPVVEEILYGVWPKTYELLDAPTNTMTWEVVDE